MASSSGLSSGSSMEDLQNLMDQRKRKRMISNRESARRSRMRKQKHMDELIVQVSDLRKENHQIITNLNITSQHLLGIEAENSVLRAQVNELSNRLQYLNGIISFLNVENGVHGAMDSTLFIDPLSLAYLNQPIMASADMFQY